jgi:hypothetical protein
MVVVKRPVLIWDDLKPVLCELEKSHALAAERESRTQETRRITLLDAQRLVDLWIEHYSELPEQARERLPLRPVHFLSPPD